MLQLMAYIRPPHFSLTDNERSPNNYFLVQKNLFRSKSTCLSTLPTDLACRSYGHEGGHVGELS